MAALVRTGDILEDYAKRTGDGYVVKFPAPTLPQNRVNDRSMAKKMYFETLFF